ncbi:MAG: hypothetical protein NTY65_04810 [Planctomycetota bacterium]|nr:hypothetical protein [Planctomycetota bacterium]
MDSEGFRNKGELRAREAWMEIPNAVILPGPQQSVSMRRFDQLQRVADQRKCRLDVLIGDTFSGAISNLLKTSGCEK